MQRLSAPRPTPAQPLVGLAARSRGSMLLGGHPAQAFCCYARFGAPTPRLTVAAGAAAAPRAGQRRPAQRLLAVSRRALAARTHLRRAAAAPGVRAMVNVDVSPSVVLGVGLIGAGVSLWQIRRVKPWISKDYDVVVSCISLLVGGILIFQGWRLDPLLLFGQLMTTGAAVSFAVEALRLRSEAYENEEKAALQDVLKRKGPDGGGSSGGAFQLPPPDQQQQQQPWASGSSEQGWAASQQWQSSQQQQQQQDGAGFFDYQQQQQPVASSSTYSYDQQQQQQAPQQQYTADGQWDYSAGQYQEADYESPAGADGTAGGYYNASSNGGDASSSGAAPSEFAFPAAYEDPAAATGAGDARSSQGAYDDQQQQPGQPQWGQQQPGRPAAPAGGRGSNYDMDDW